MSFDMAIGPSPVTVIHFVGVTVHSLNELRIFYAVRCWLACKMKVGLWQSPKRLFALAVFDPSLSQPEV